MTAKILYMGDYREKKLEKKFQEGTTDGLKRVMLLRDINYLDGYKRSPEDIEEED